MRIRYVLVSAFWLLASSLLTVGCAASSQYMQPAPGARLSPLRADRASVVFMRPSEFGFAIRFRLLDEKKRFLGDALAQQYWESSVEPGEHWFYATAENTGVLHATLEAGHRYYVVVRPYMGAWKARVELTPLSTHTEDWDKRSQWLQGGTLVRVDVAGGQADLNSSGSDADEAVREGQEAWRDASDAWRAGHQLRPADAEPGAVVPAPPAQPASMPLPPSAAPVSAPEPAPAVAPAVTPSAPPTVPAAAPAAPAS